MSDQEPKTNEAPAGPATPPAPAGEPAAVERAERPRAPEGDRGGRYRPRDRQDSEGEAEGGRPPGRDRFKDGRPRFRPFFKRKICKFCARKIPLSYREADTLRRFITERGKILPRRITGTCPKHQRRLAKAIKQARSLAILPFVER
jgi:small subunit ribosomal protein S18